MNQCASDVRGFVGTSSPISGTYSPGLTYKLAERIQRLGDDGAIYAKRLRAYELKIRHGGVLGGEGSVACYYDQNGGRLTYLTNLNLGHDGRAPALAIQTTALKAYCNAKGATKAQFLLTGC